MHHLPFTFDTLMSTMSSLRSRACLQIRSSRCIPRRAARRNVHHDSRNTGSSGGGRSHANENTNGCTQANMTARSRGNGGNSDSHERPSRPRGEAISVNTLIASFATLLVGMAAGGVGAAVWVSGMEGSGLLAGTDPPLQGRFQGWPPDFGHEPGDCRAQGHCCCCE